MDDHLSRLGKIEGQIRGLQKMVEADSWCPDVVIQLTSAICGLQEVAAGLLNDRLATASPATSAGRTPRAKRPWPR